MRWSPTNSIKKDLGHKENWGWGAEKKEMDLER